MKQLKYVSRFKLLFGALLCSCYNEAYSLTEDSIVYDNTIEIPPPAVATNNNVGAIPKHYE